MNRILEFREINTSSHSNRGFWHRVHYITAPCCPGSGEVYVGTGRRTLHFIFGFINLYWNPRPVRGTQWLAQPQSPLPLIWGPHWLHLGQFAHSLPRGQRESKGNESLGFGESSTHPHQGSLLSECPQLRAWERRQSIIKQQCCEFGKEARPILSNSIPGGIGRVYCGQSLLRAEFPAEFTVPSHVAQGPHWGRWGQNPTVLTLLESDF